MKNPLLAYMFLILYLPVPFSGQRLAPPRNYHSEDDDDDQPLLDDEKDEVVAFQGNVSDGNRSVLPETSSNETGTSVTEKGLYVGASCEFTCSSRLQHVYCNPVTSTCECEKKYPVKLNNPYSGCRKPKKLGEQCYYHEACEYTDQHASCIQIHHNAICQCQSGYHSVSIQKPSKKVFCAEGKKYVQVITTDFSTFAGVLSGIAILSGLICFVLHLFNQNLYGSGGRRHRFGNANLAPPILFSSDPGSRRPSIASVHSSNSVRSYSARRYEREREQKEEREMQRRLSKMTSQSASRIAPTPSPHSTDDLLPTLEEDKQIPPLATKEDSTTSFQEESLPSTSKQFQ
ncbi:uncharacterized protein LOC143192590 isoform X7 [Rhynchophorus ferrugineus]|uniref:uncharacterized protein LOC143192590 isoform X7 n=1 Tax=Rhynchophorus ferrugineus TaxID=354439 RepID=UPI003FCE22C3